jgi:hypothetical protein
MSGQCAHAVVQRKPSAAAPARIEYLVGARSLSRLTDFLKTHVGHLGPEVSVN